MLLALILAQLASVAGRKSAKYARTLSAANTGDSLLQGNSLRLNKRKRDHFMACVWKTYL